MSILLRRLSVAGLCTVAALPCAAQSLRGSKASVDRMYRRALAERLTFYETPRGVRNAVAAGRLERLEPGDNYALHRVGYPFVQSATATFVERLAAQYRATCDEPMQVTSAVRPATRQPPNSVARSVHPTGMAVDLRKPTDAKCRSWLRERLLELERVGVLEATEEYGPPHFHVAVYPTAYRRYVASQDRATQSKSLATVGSTGATKYRVRRGDTLWAIARAHDTTVRAIRVANRLAGTVIRPGDEILIPRGP